MTQLRPEFTSVYRLFLRTVSAAVLHHPQATRNLRRLWRPIFESGARRVTLRQPLPSQHCSSAVEVKVEEGSSSSPKPELQQHARDWSKLWDQRSAFPKTFYIRQKGLLKKKQKSTRSIVNNTLALLYHSSQNRGLPHKLTRNLAFLVTSEHQRVRSYKLNAWDPRRPQQFSNLTEKARRKQEENKRFQEFVAGSWAPLGQAVKLAEAKDELMLGRVRVRGWKAKFMRERGL